MLSGRLLQLGPCCAHHLELRLELLLHLIGLRLRGDTARKSPLPLQIVELSERMLQLGSDRDDVLGVLNHERVRAAGADWRRITRRETETAGVPEVAAAARDVVRADAAVADRPET